jgi:hypothetical protein
LGDRTRVDGAFRRLDRVASRSTGDFAGTRLQMLRDEGDRLRSSHQG